MQIYDALKKDHETVKQLLDEVIACDKQDEHCDQLIEEVRDALIPHSRAEEAVFYNTLRSLNADREELMHGYKEHLEAETMLRTLQAKDKLNIKSWKETARKLKEALEHHIQEEETTIFGIARNMLTDDEAEKICDAFEKLKPEVKDQNILQTSLKMVANMMPPRFSKTVLNETRS